MELGPGGHGVSPAELDALRALLNTARHGVPCTAHAFAPFVCAIERVRWIRGFGAMGRCECGDLR